MTNMNVNTNYNAVNIPNIKNLPVIEMKPGQVFQGTILRVHPNNIAIVQLGEAIFPAKLSAQLPIGQKIIMEVIEATNPITLKAISEHMPSFQQKTDLLKGEFKHLENIDIKSLLQNIGLKPTKENIMFAEQLTKYNLPINKDNLTLIQRLTANATNSTNIKEIVESMKIAENKSLPLTENTVKSIQSFVFGKGIDNLMKDVQSNIHLLLSSKKEFPVSVKPILESLTKALSDLIKMDTPKVEQNHNISSQKTTVVNKESSHSRQYRDNPTLTVKETNSNNQNNPINLEIIKGYYIV